MNRVYKLIIGALVWNIGVMFYAAVVHEAATSIYWEKGHGNLGSIYEVAGLFMLFAYFFCVPIITILWIQEKES